ncbi:hypothetical protein IM660_04670 [Ruania alkalisoli]|uniref:M1 family metallopeptidase n=1 Tax=Ruania alkalisoli TaxID=2779775 RepID=A0A7M1SVJ6_9MICO|nr:hypothetical protein [Ruania alkalisoli]QOR71589.1 hypothetical protein IM660_04670 [Ruania alkalisoli]
MTRPCTAPAPATAWRACAVLVLALLLVGLPGTPTANAAEGLTEETHARYVVGEEGALTAEVTTTITNVTPDQGAQYYYWTDYGIGVPASATDVQAVSGGTALTVRITADEADPTHHWARASFPPLRYGQSRTIEWSYTIAGAPLRSEEVTRVGPGYAVFVAQAIGDEGSVSVEVVAPSGLELHAATELDSELQGQHRVYRTEEYIDDWGVWTPISLRDPDQSETVEVPIGGVVALDVQSLPGDEVWRDFAVERIETGMPVLEELVGSPWPAEVRTVREDVSPHVIGYAWFDGWGDEIVVGEDLDEVTLYHELGHAWFAPPQFSGRWLQEGLTEETAHRTIERLGGEGERRPRPDRDGDHALPLLEWSGAHQQTETDSYGYPASAAAIQDVFSDADDATFTAVVSAAYAGESAYEEPGSQDNRGAVDWRRFLDLAAERGGLDAESAFRTWVVASEQAADLDVRAEARAQYAALDHGHWQAPFGLRTEMTDWDFAAAQESMAALTPVAAHALAVQVAADEAGLDVPEQVREGYEEAESAEDYAALEAALPRAAATIGQVAEVTQLVAAERDPVSELGEAVLRIETVTTAAAGALSVGDIDRAGSLAEAAAERAGWATLTGAGLVLAAVLVLGLIVGAPLLAHRRRATQVPAVAAEFPGVGEPRDVG